MPPKRTKLNITFVHPDLGIGGAERLILDLAVALRQNNHKITFLTNHYNPDHAFLEMREFPVEVIGDWLPRSIFGRCQALCAYLRMVYLALTYIFFGAKNKTPQDLYFVDLIPISIPILKWANKSVIYYCHHPDLLASAPGGVLKRAYRAPIDYLEMVSTKSADLLLVNSKYTASVFRRTFPQIKQDVHVLYPTISLNFYQAAMEIRQRNNEDFPDETYNDIFNMLHIGTVYGKMRKEAFKDCTLFVSVNRFHPAKKLELAVLAMEQLRKKVSVEEWPKTLLVLAGGYDPASSINAAYYDKLRQLVADKQLAPNVIFDRSISDERKLLMLANCNCVLYTPTNEHFGIVPLEAMALAKPVIACASGGPCETVEHGVTGFLCDSTPGQMADYMARIVRQGEQVRGMGARGRKVLLERFSFEAFAKQLDEILRAFRAKKGF